MAHPEQPLLPLMVDLATVDASDRLGIQSHLALVAAAAGPACLVWRDGLGRDVCVAHNARFGALFGRAPLVGQVLLAALPELQGAWGWAVEKALTGTGAACDAVPVPGRREGSRAEHHAASWLPVRDSAGSPRGALGFLHDVTGMVERLRRLVGSVAHDLQDPRVGMRLVAGQLREDRPAAAAEADRMVSLAVRMSRLVDELSSFARLAAGDGLRLHTRPCDLGSVVQNTCDELAGLGAAPIEVSAASIYGLWDADAIRRLLTNLVNNSRRYGPLGGLISVRCEVEGSAAMIEVVDEGIGFDESEAAQLFEPWRRGSSSGPAGTGLGLYIAREIVRAHGGRIVPERQQSGFAMRVTLPLGGSGVLKRVDR
jgi:signal transduction histidine kinase